MIPVTIQKEIEIAASAACVWQFLGSEAGLRQWWGTDLTLEAKPGGYCAERSLYQGRVRDWQGQVTVYEPPRHLALLLRNANATKSGPAWMTISLLLHETQGRTRVMLVHQAFDFVSEQAAVGQPIPALPSSLVAPQARWRSSQPQPVLESGVTAGGAQLLLAPQSAVVHSVWRAQTAAGWDGRLQALAIQVVQYSDER